MSTAQTAAVGTLMLEQWMRSYRPEELFDDGFSHQGPGLIDTVLAMKGTVVRIYLPPDANCRLSVADHCFRSQDVPVSLVDSLFGRYHGLLSGRPH